VVQQQSGFADRRVAHFDAVGKAGGFVDGTADDSARGERLVRQPVELDERRRRQAFDAEGHDAISWS